MFSTLLRNGRIGILNVSSRRSWVNLRGGLRKRYIHWFVSLPSFVNICICEQSIERSTSGCPERRTWWFGRIYERTRASKCVRSIVWRRRLKFIPMRRRFRCNVWYGTTKPELFSKFIQRRKTLLVMGSPVMVKWQWTSHYTYRLHPKSFIIGFRRRQSNILNGG